jgi:hypothetical protein
MQDSRCRDTRCRIQDAGYRIQGFKDGLGDNVR